MSNLWSLKSLDMSQCTGLKRIPYQFCISCLLTSIELSTSLTQIDSMAFEGGAFFLSTSSTTSLEKIDHSVP